MGVGRGRASAMQAKVSKPYIMCFFLLEDVFTRKANQEKRCVGSVYFLHQPISGAGLINDLIMFVART